MPPRTHIVLTQFYCFLLRADKVTAEKNGPSKALSNNSSSSPPSSNSHVIAGHNTTNNSNTTATAAATASSSPPHQLEHSSVVAPVVADNSVTPDALSPADSLAVTQTTLTASDDENTSTTAVTTGVEVNHINNHADKALSSGTTSAYDNGAAIIPELRTTYEEDDAMPAITNADASAAGKEVSTGSLKKVIAMVCFLVPGLSLIAWCVFRWSTFSIWWTTRAIRTKRRTKTTTRPTTRRFRRSRALCSHAPKGIHINYTCSPSTLFTHHTSTTLHHHPWLHLPQGACEFTETHPKTPQTIH